LLDESKHRAMIDVALPLVGMFHVNLEEAASLTGKINTLIARAKQHGDHTSPEDVVTLDEVKEIAATLLTRGPGMVAISLGCNGAFVATSSDERRLHATFRSLAKTHTCGKWIGLSEYVPAFAATAGKRLNATGAGDSFIGGLLAALMLPEVSSLRKAIQLGHAAALQRIEEGRTRLKADEIVKAIDRRGYYQHLVPVNASLKAAASSE